MIAYYILVVATFALPWLIIGASLVKIAGRKTPKPPDRPLGRRP